jgi:hypothetical protein
MRAKMNHKNKIKIKISRFEDGRLLLQLGRPSRRRKDFEREKKGSFFS